jgi:hypothetical protein
MVEYHPGMVVLCSVGALAHVEPANPVPQYHDGRKRRIRHRISGTPSGYPLRAYQERELTLYGGSERQRMPQKTKHRARRSRLSCMGTRVAIRRVRYDAAAASRHFATGKEIDPRGAEAAIGNVGRNHVMAVCRQYVGHRAVAAAGFPDIGPRRWTCRSSASVTHFGVA